MKKLFQKVAVITLLSTSAINVTPVQSQAIIGASVGFVGLAVLGAAVCAGAHFIPEGALGGRLNRGGIALYGLVALDDKGAVNPHFAAMKQDAAQSLGVTQEEMTAYNSEIDQINSISQTIFSDSLKSNLQGQKLEDFINQQWSTNGKELSPDTRVALTKVRAAVRASSSDQSSS